MVIFWLMIFFADKIRLKNQNKYNIPCKLLDIIYLRRFYVCAKRKSIIVSGSCFSFKKAIFAALINT